MARTREFDTDAVLRSAVTAFRRTGFEGTTLQDLEQATGLGRGSLYAAFGSKEGLYLAAIDRYRDDYAMPLVEVLAGPGTARDLIRKVLIGVVDEIVLDGARHACLIVSTAVERVRHDAAAAQRVRETTEAFEDALTAVITAAQTSGEMATTCHPIDLARFFVSVTHGMRVAGSISPDRRRLTSMVDIALRCLE